MTHFEAIGWKGHILTVSHLSDSLTYECQVLCILLLCYIHHMLL